MKKKRKETKNNSKTLNFRAYQSDDEENPANLIEFKNKRRTEYKKNKFENLKEGTEKKVKKIFVSEHKNYDCFDEDREKENQSNLSSAGLTTSAL